MSKKIVALVSVLLFVLGCIGGWFLHSLMVKKDYEAAWTGYEKEVKAWQDVSERYQVLAPMCGELAGEAECGELKTAGEEAAKVAQSLPLDLKKAKSALKEEKQKLGKAAKEIKTEREKFEPAVVKVEKAAETSVADKFAPVVEEAEKKANEANGLVGSLKGKVKDENTLKALESAVSELSSACGKWKGKDAPTGQEGVRAYLELKRLTLTCNDAASKANESHNQWQKEEDKRIAAQVAGEYGSASEAGGITIDVKADTTFISEALIGWDVSSGTRLKGQGRFTNFHKVSDYVYEATIADANMAVTHKDPNVIDISGDDIGLSSSVNGGRATFYLKGAPREVLPSGILDIYAQDNGLAPAEYGSYNPLQIPLNKKCVVFPNRNVYCES